MESYQITKWCQHFLKDALTEGDFCIDATAGNGNDTLFLCQTVGASGHVLAFDIQKGALEQTEKRLCKAGVEKRARLILDSHVNMEKYIEKESVDGIMFNFGYLPGGNHKISTKSETSIAAVRTGLQLLKPKGIMSLCIYSGGDSGWEEKDCLLDFLHQLDSKKYLVIVSQYYNRQNHPPIPVLIIKLKGENGSTHE